MNHSQITSFIWSVADLIRDTSKRGKYQDVILPLTVLRRIDQVLEPAKEKVLEVCVEYNYKLDNPDDLLIKGRSSGPSPQVAWAVSRCRFRWYTERDRATTFRPFHETGVRAEIPRVGTVRPSKVD